MSFNSPPQARRRQFNQRAVGVAHVEARSAARPAIFADDLHTLFGEPTTPGAEIIGLDREGEMQAPAAVVSGNHATGFDHVPLGRAGLKHQQNAAFGDLEGDKARRIDKSPEAEQIAIEGRRAFEVARVERRFQDALKSTARRPAPPSLSPDAFN